MNTQLSPQKLEIWRLFITAQAKLIKQIDADLRSADTIPLHWYDVLIELYEADGHKLRMSDLAERVVLTRSGLTRLVDRLEKEAYIERSIDPEDRRGFYAHITSAGIAAMKAAWTVYSQSIAEHFGDHFDDQEVETILATLQRILTHLD